jgi:DNA-binding transcriptional ArsR family regulator
MLMADQPGSSSPPAEKTRIERLLPDHSAPRASVPIDAVNGVRITVGISPMPTLGILVFDSVQETSRLGAPAQLRRAIRSHLRARDVRALAPFTGRATTPPSLIGERIATPMGLARILCGDPGPGLTSLSDELGAITATDADAFIDSVQECAAESSSDSWGALLTDPSRWLGEYATALRRAWRGVEALWRQSIGLLAGERERVEAAVARGASVDLLTALHRRAVIADGAWHLPTDVQPVEYRLAGRFTVCPMIADPTITTLFSDGAGALPGLFYPVPAADRAFDANPPEPASLEALLGRPRATILKELERPRRPGQIAEALHTVPGGATHHLRQLEAAGLVTRERQGQSIIVERTTRGTSLLAIYGVR